MSMTPEQIEAFLAEKRNVIVCALRKDGRPQMTPTWFHWDGSRFVISMAKDTYKYRNLQRDPRVQLLVDDAEAYRSVLVDGTASFVEDLDEMMPLVRAVRSKHGMAPEEDGPMKERMERDRRCVLVVTPDKPMSAWSSWT